jgi:hypothetical protein
MVSCGHAALLKYSEYRSLIESGNDGWVNTTNVVILGDNVYDQFVTLLVQQQQPISYVQQPMHIPHTNEHMMKYIMKVVEIVGICLAVILFMVLTRLGVMACKSYGCFAIGRRKWDRMIGQQQPLMVPHPNAPLIGPLAAPVQLGNLVVRGDYGAVNNGQRSAQVSDDLLNYLRPYSTWQPRTAGLLRNLVGHARLWAKRNDVAQDVFARILGPTTAHAMSLSDGEVYGLNYMNSEGVRAATSMINDAIRTNTYSTPWRHFCQRFWGLERWPAASVTLAAS